MHRTVSRTSALIAPRRAARGLALALVLGAATACGGDKEHNPLKVDSTLLTSDRGDSSGRRRAEAGGEVERAGALVPVSHRVDEESYRRWRAAERNLRDLDDTDRATPAVELPLAGTDEEHFERLTRRIADDAAARGAIEEAGLTVRDYVRLTVALHQAVAVYDAERMARQLGVPEENVRFVRRKGDEIRRLGRHGHVIVVDGAATGGATGDARRERGR
jgi:hypothetical protein